MFTVPDLSFGVMKDFFLLLFLDFDSSKIFNSDYL